MEVGLFLIHVVVGLLIAAHGSQKLFGWFGGGGVEGTGGMMESLGLVPGKRMAVAGGAAEFTGGVLLALGLLVPAAAALIASTCFVASRTAHAGKGPWIAGGGWEYVLVLATVAIGLAFKRRRQVVARPRDRLERLRILVGHRCGGRGADRSHRRSCGCTPHVDRFARPTRRGRPDRGRPPVGQRLDQPSCRGSYAGSRSTRPRGASTRSTCTVTGSPSRIVRPEFSPTNAVSVLVEVEAVAAHAAAGQEALEALLAEAHEYARADHAGDLALELLVVVVAQPALEQEGEAHVLRLPLHPHRRPFGRGGRRSPPPPSRTRAAGPRPGRARPAAPGARPGRDSAGSAR